jgi:signal transduction histidine kinase
MDENTHFAPALRSSIEAILNEHELVDSQKLFSEIFGAMAGISAIINSNRQIVYANNEFLDFLGLKSLEPVLGKRPGEIISCIHSSEESGCGTSQACKYCGAVNAVMESQRTNQKSSKETRISSYVEGRQLSWDLNITSVPIVLANQTFYVLTLQDISNEKRIIMIERIFFHDLLNTASGLNGLLSILKTETDPEEVNQLVSQSEEASSNIIEEIMIYRQLRAAENGDIQVSIEKVNSLEFLSTAIERISYHEAALGKKIIIAEDSAVINFETDRILLRRVLINLLKNAIEATPAGGLVVAGIEERADKIRFWVKNDGVIPHDIQLQIFQRSFSTKGNGRGIGTYSIRLLSENYLKGNVSFVSNEAEGTVFSVELNINWK